MTLNLTDGQRTTESTLRRGLLVCGVLASLLYIGTDILAGLQWEGYSFTSQFISELFAIGAPTSGLVVPLFTMSNVFLIAGSGGFEGSTVS